MFANLIMAKMQIIKRKEEKNYSKNTKKNIINRNNII
jgi:hypothetical protein